ncbi:Oxygen sensor histidine kinase NreB [compost metagenome]
MKGPVEPKNVDVPSTSAEARHRRLLRRFMVLQEDERRQVARELHEDAGQMLTSLLFGIKLLEGSSSLDETNRLLPELKRQVWETLESLRQISVSLRPSLLEDLGLVSTLRSYARDFGSRQPMEVAFSVEGEEVRLDPMVEVTVFRIAQEALLNASKYSRATQVSVAMSFAAGELTVKIEDNGVGMDSRLLEDGPQGPPVGIWGMQERAAFLGGTCRIETAPGKGVRVHLSLPLP